MSTRPTRDRAIVATMLTLIAAFGVGWLMARAITAPASPTPAAPLRVVDTVPASMSTVLSLTAAPAHTGDPNRPAPRLPTSPFSTWELHLELDAPEDGADRPVALAAWQVRITLSDAHAVGLEGGRGAFVEPPHYDPAALATGTLVIAAFTVEPIDDEVHAASASHVATLHLHAHADGAPSAELLVEAASLSDGTPVTARATLVRRTEE